MIAPKGYCVMAKYLSAVVDAYPPTQARIAELEAKLCRAEQEAAMREAELKQRLAQTHKYAISQPPVGSSGPPPAPPPPGSMSPASFSPRLGACYSHVTPPTPSSPNPGAEGGIGPDQLAKVRSNAMVP